MCGERNQVGTAVICVYAPDTRRQYYCFQCWPVISDRAAVDIPDLQKESKADAQMIGMLFGVKSAKKNDRPEGSLHEISLEMRADGTIAEESMDIRVEMPVSLIVDGVPFKRYHLTGDELEAHKAKVRERLDVD
jgi:hypothetical protein